jgi:hypothetical protein
MSDYIKYIDGEYIPMTAEEIEIRQAEEAESQNTVVYEPVNPEMNALIDAIIDLNIRLLLIEGGV